MATIYNTYTNYLNATYESDLIYNYVPAYIHGQYGDDQISNAAQVAFINGDDGNDAIVNYAGNSQTYLDGGAGNDYIINAGSGISSLYGGYGVYNYYDDNDILVGSPYAVDFFIVGEYCGYDVIQNYEWNDAIYCATTSGYAPYVHEEGNDVWIEGAAMMVVVQGAAGKQLNFGYTYGYGGISFDMAEENLWGDANIFTGTADADDIFIGKSGGDDLIFNVAQDDTIHLCDVTLSDIVATAVNDKSVAISFNTGKTVAVELTENLSPTFQLSDGTRYAYNREASAWQQK